MKRFLLGFALLLASISSISAQYEDRGWKLNPEVGIWFGPAAPFPGSELSDILGPYIGGGAYGRIQLPWKNLYSELGISINGYRSSAIEKLDTVPIYLSINYKIPLKVRLNLFLKVGGGAVYATNYPEQHSNWLPLGFIGTEVSFPMGKTTTLGLKMDYNLIYEEHLSAPPDSPDFKIINGHMINVGIVITFKLING